LGEFLALAESLRYIAQNNESNELNIIVNGLDIANSKYLDNQKSPSKVAGEPGNTSGHFFLAQYWARALANQTNSNVIAHKFSSIADALENNEQKIMDELLFVEGTPKEIGGYYNPDISKVSAAMRPSATLNSIIDDI